VETVAGAQEVLLWGTLELKRIGDEAGGDASRALSDGGIDLADPLLCRTTAVGMVAAW
jgi:hypothetical protein